MSVPEAVRIIQDAIARANYGRADLLCRRTLESLPDFPWATLLLAETALRIGETDACDRWCAVTEEKLRLYPSESFAEAAIELARIRSEFKKQIPATQSGGYLLIKCWGYGFWSDVEHVLGALLISEMSNRIPIVHWGENSYFTDDPQQDAFATFYEPIAPIGLDELAAKAGKIYPRRWTKENLGAAGENLFEGGGARQSGLDLLNRPEPVVVSDYFVQVMELLPWLKETHWLYGADPMRATQLLYEKYLVVQPAIQAEIKAFTADNFDHRPTLAVHVRNKDKSLEDPNVYAQSSEIPSIVDTYLEHYPELRLFLLTDSTEVIDEYAARYGDRIFSTDCARADSIVPVTWRESESRRRLGVEVIKDTHIAAACDMFIGHGGSSVACMVACLKSWPDGACRLIGDNVKTRRNWLIHDW